MKFLLICKKTLIVLLFIIFTCLILLINLKTPLIGEDFVLASPVAYQKASISIRIPQIITKICLQIQYWNARIGEQFAIIFSSFDKNIFNILNTIILLGFCYLAIVFSKGELPRLNQIFTYFLISLCVSFLIVFIPALGEIFFWMDGATNYLWGIVILMLFFLPYRFLFKGRDVLNKRPFMIILFYLMAIFAGFTNENTVPVILLLNLTQMVWLIKYRKSEIRLPRWQWIGTTILGLSFLLFIFLRSTKHRMNYYSTLYSITDPNVMYYLQRAKVIFSDYIKVTYPLILFVACITIFFIAIAFIRKWKLSEESQNNLKIIVLMIGMSIISQVIMVMVPYYEVRVGLITWFFWMVLLIFVVEEFYMRSKLPLYFLVIFIILGLFQAGQTLKIYNQFYYEAMSRHYLLLTISSEGATSAQVESFMTQSSRMLNPREEYLLFENQLYANYYGLKSIDIIQTDRSP